MTSASEKTDDQTDWSQRYETIQHLLYDPEGLVSNGAVYPQWASDTVFWYMRTSAEGIEIRIVDSQLRSTESLPVSKLGSALEEHDPGLAPVVDRSIQPVSLDSKAEHVDFKHEGTRWTYEISTRSLRRGSDTSPRDGEGISIAPNGTTKVLVRDYNLWLETDNSEETALTADGEEANAYANGPLAARAYKLASGAPPQGLWSPDSKYFFTLRTDERLVRSLPNMEYLPDHGVRPQVRTNRTSLPGDEHITEFTLLLVNAGTGTTTHLDFPSLPAVRMNDTIFDAGLAWWSADSGTVYFVILARGEKRAQVVACDPATGATRVVFSEESDTPLDLSVNVYGPCLIRSLPSTNELIWYSERSGQGHLYLYDLETGLMKRQLTRGAWQVRELLAIDEKNREIFILAGGLNGAVGPYQVRPCKVSLDEAEDSLVVLRDDEGDHSVWRPDEYQLLAVAFVAGINAGFVSGVSPGADYFVDTITRIDGLPVTILCDRNGVQVMELERAVNVGLPSAWRWPVRVQTKAADGETDIFGLLFFPVDYDPERSYPVIDHIYGGPQLRNCPQGAFGDLVNTDNFLQTAAFAQLGAFALVLDGRGTAERDREFHRTSWRKVHEASNLEDHVAAIRQLKSSYPAMDLDRVGITGFSAGGYASAHAALRFGDFFSVAVAGGGNYDQSLFWHTWGERYHGFFDNEHYQTQAAKTYAEGLTGKILFIHGLRDWGCHPAALFQLLQALIEKNKDYDLVLLPAAGHSLTGYGVRRRLDYFVTHLFGQNPPAGPFTFATSFDEAAAGLLKHAPTISEELADAH